MDVLPLPARRVRPVEVDHCPACRLVWFDPLESVLLAGLGWVQLLRRLDETAVAASTAAPATAGCPVCRAGLVPVHNRTRFGRFPALECPHRHGHLHSHAGLLAERGLVRGLLPPERSALRSERRQLHCLACGATVDGRGDDCSFCGSPLVVIDLPRLAHALTVQTASDTPSPPPPPGGGLLLVWPCRGCGAPLDPVAQTGCPHCGHALVATGLPDLKPLLDSAEQALQPPPPRPWRPRPGKRPLGWRDTHLQRLRGLWRDEHQRVTSAAAAALLVAVVLAFAWLWRR